MLRLLGLAVLALSLLSTTRISHSQAKDSGPIGVATAVSLCRAHPSMKQRLWIRGWFVPVELYSDKVEGGLFNSRCAVPLTTVDQWDAQGHWKRYGALYVRIGTQASFGPRELTLHGQLSCSSFTFQTDRDPFAPPQLKAVYGSGRQGSAGRTTWVVAGGVKLTLSVPGQVYPRDALAQVHVALQNVSKRTVWFWSTGVSLPGFASPQAEVLDARGKAVFPPAMPYMPPLPGPPPSPEPLSPGQIVGENEYIVMRGAQIRATERINTSLSGDIRRAANMIATQPISVRLTSEAPPRLVVHQSGEGPAVDVVRPAHLTGQPLLLDYADCGETATGPRYDYNEVWVRSRLHLIPVCSPVQAWHIRLAWLNHPVAALDYTSPSPTQTPLETPTVTPTQIPFQTPKVTPTPLSTSAPSAARPSFGDLLHRAFVAMKDVHALHATGVHSPVDSSATMHLAIQSDCFQSLAGPL